MDIAPISSFIALAHELNKSGPSKEFGQIEEYIESKGDLTKGIILDVRG